MNKETTFEKLVKTLSVEQLKLLQEYMHEESTEVKKIIESIKQ